MNTDIAREEEYNVQMPKKDLIYADTVLNETIRVRDVDEEEGFVSYTEEGDVQNVHTNTMQRFLASLASGRFVSLGERTAGGKVLSSNEEVAAVFQELYGGDPRHQDPVEIARQVICQRISETVIFES